MSSDPANRTKRPSESQRFSLLRRRHAYAIIPSEMNDYDPDGFRTLTLRADKASRSAVCEGLSTLHYGDSIVAVVTGVGGCDPDDLVFGIYGPASQRLDEVGNSGWAFLPGRTDAVYAEISLYTANCETLCAALAPGEPTEARLYLCESSGKTWLDTSVSLYPNPTLSGGSAGTANQFVLRSSVRALANAVAAMPSLNAFQREQKLDALLAGLAAL